MPLRVPNSGRGRPRRLVHRQHSAAPTLVLWQWAGLLKDSWTVGATGRVLAVTGLLRVRPVSWSGEERKQGPMKNTAVGQVPACFVAVLGCVSLVGCFAATFGTRQIAEDQIVSQIRKGKSTEAHVETVLGPPAHVFLADAQEDVWSYHYSRSSTRATMCVPCVSLLAGGVGMETHMLTYGLRRKAL